MQLIARGKATVPYEVRDVDVLWLLRAVQAEGLLPEQVAAVLVNGFVWNRAQGGKGTLTDWVRAYAQPVNPKHFPGGSKYNESIANATTDEGRAAIERKAKARRDVHSTRTTFTPRVQRAVASALNGSTKFPPEATDYAAPWVDASVKGYRPIGVAKANQNRLWARPGTEGWDGYAVSGASLAVRKFPWFTVLACIVGAVGVTYMFTRGRYGFVG